MAPARHACRPRRQLRAVQPRGGRRGSAPRDRVRRHPRGAEIDRRPGDTARRRRAAALGHRRRPVRPRAWPPPRPPRRGGDHALQVRRRRDRGPGRRAAGV